MRWTLMAASTGMASALVLTSGFTTSADAGPTAAFELEHARANARAGGPISDYDAELLERWGNSTGGPDWRKQYRAQKHYRDAPPRTYRSKKKTRVHHD